MHRKALAIGCVIALLAVGTFVWAQAPKPAAPPAGDTRLDKIIEQNTQLLQKQDDILKKLDDLSREIAQIRRRTS